MTQEILNNDNGVLSVGIPSDSHKRERMIEALKYQLEHDTNDKDKAIHKQALKALEGDE